MPNCFYVSGGSGDGLALNKRQAITWTNVEEIPDAIIGNILRLR